MFEIEYKIFKEDVSSIENEEFYGDEGYLVVYINGNKYGDMEKAEIFILSVSIYRIFRFLFEALVFLCEEDKNEVYISDIESDKVWYRIEYLQDKNYKISEVHSVKADGARGIEPVIKNYKVEWEEIIPSEMFLKELINKAGRYLNDLHVLNKKNKYLDELEELIGKVRSYSNTKV